MKTETLILTVPIEIKFKKGQRKDCLRALNDHITDFFPMAGWAASDEWKYKSLKKTLRKP